MMRCGLKRGSLMMVLLVSAGALMVGPLSASGSARRQATSGAQSADAEQIVIPPGKEKLPAEQVFKNIEILKGRPASHLPGMMTTLDDLLGVKCTYCHNPDAWEKEPPAKVTSRHMFATMDHMNEKYFSGTNPNPITCWTCHRGDPKPTTGLQEIMTGLQDLPAQRKEAIDGVMADLGENKDKPAGEVFHNIQFFKGVPASRLLKIMSVYTVVLGVDCGHCHVVGKWEKDDKPAKRTVITMNHVVDDVNQELFDGQPKVACYTCHRGVEKPENIKK